MPDPSRIYALPLHMSVPESTTDGKPVEVELRVRDGECFFVRASAETDCRLLLEDLVHRADGKLIEFFTVKDVPADRVLAMAKRESAITEARVVREELDGGLFQFVVSGRCVTATLAEAGAITQAVSASSGEGRVVAEVPPHVEVREVIEAFGRRHPDSELVACRRSDQSLSVRTEQSIEATLADCLTDKQFEVLKTAYLNGYFDWPRESTAKACAEALGITQPTFSQHVRRAQHRVFEVVFDPDARDH